MNRAARACLIGQEASYLPGERNSAGRSVVANSFRNFLLCRAKFLSASTSAWSLVSPLGVQLHRYPSSSPALLEWSGARSARIDSRERAKLRRAPGNLIAASRRVLPLIRQSSRGAARYYRLAGARKNRPRSCIVFRFNSSPPPLLGCLV